MYPHPHTQLYMNVHSSIIHISPKAEAVQVSASRRVGKYSMAHRAVELPLGRKKE